MKLRAFVLSVGMGLGFGALTLAPVHAQAADGTLTQSSSGGGASSAPQSSGKKGASDLPDEMKCGVSCRYSRANDNLTFQAVYLLKKIETIDKLVKKADEDGDDAAGDQARKAMGGLCPQSVSEIADCVTRYKAFQKAALLEIRQSIGKNEDIMARLSSGRKEDGTADAEALAFDIGADRPAYVPDVPTLSDLETAYLNGKLRPAGGRYTSKDVQKWSMELVRSNPAARTIEFRKVSVSGNPFQSEEASYRLYMTSKDGNGGDKADPKAAALYKSAMTEVDKVAKEKPDPTDVTLTNSPRTLKKDDKASYDAFMETRSLLNSRIDEDLKKDPERAAQRKLANTPKPKPGASPSPKPSASPVAGNDSHDLKVRASRVPSSKERAYEEEERVKIPEGLKNSRYIKYNIHDLLDDADTATK